MIHTLFVDNDLEKEISVTPLENTKETSISIKNYSNIESVYLKPKELSDFIGILLHVQAKIKRDNGRK